MSKIPQATQLPPIMIPDRAVAQALEATLDALVAAVVAKLPQPGVPWSAAQRVDWLRMFDMASRVSYGPCEGITIEIVGPLHSEAPGAAFRVPAPAVARQVIEAAQDKTQLLAHSAYAFYVDLEGCVRRSSDGERVVSDECQGEEIYDYRPAGSDGRDSSALTWADDSTGAQGDLTLCGPGR